MPLLELIPTLRSCLTLSLALSSDRRKKVEMVSQLFIIFLSCRFFFRHLFVFISLFFFVIHSRTSQIVLLTLLFFVLLMGKQNLGRFFQPIESLIKYHKTGASVFFFPLLFFFSVFNAFCICDTIANQQPKKDGEQKHVLVCPKGIFFVGGFS